MTVGVSTEALRQAIAEARAQPLGYRRALLVEGVPALVILALCALALLGGVR